MIYGLATVLATYASVRLYERYLKKDTSQAQQQSAQVTQHTSELEDGTEKTTTTSRLVSSMIKSNTNHDNKRYVMLSGVTAGLATARLFIPVLTLPTLAIFTYTAIPYLRQTEQSLVKDKKIDGYVLYSVADMMMLSMGAYVSASIGIGLLHLSKYILSNAKERSKKELVNIFSQQPDKVWVLKEGSEVQLPIDEVKENDILVVNAGDIIPVDGNVVAGIAAVDQKVLTGESQPRDKTAGDHVYASTMVISGRICIKMEQSGQETIVAKIGDIINNSIEFKGNQALKGEKWADSFTTPMLGLALVSGPFLGPTATVGILYCHIANTIRVIAPLGTLNHLNIAAKNGILIKDGHALEELATVDTVIFDKTGTLTQEIPEVGEIVLCDTQYSQDDILLYAAAAEQKSVHPIAKAILAKAEEQNLTLPEIEDSSYDIGYGISVEIDHKTIQIGSIRFMQMKEIDIPKAIQHKMDNALALGHSVIMLAIDAKLCGILEIHTIVRPEAEQTIQTLRQNGIKCMAIVSGDHELPTQALASSLKMDNYFHDTLPEEKAKIVEKLQQKGKKVAIVGDGVNDAIAMEKADVSISLSGASTIATDVAQVVLMDGSLTHIPQLFELSEKLDKNLSRSLILNLVPSAIALGGVFFFRLGMLTTILISQSSLAFGTFNALLPLRMKTDEADQDKSTEIDTAMGSSEESVEADNTENEHVVTALPRKWLDFNPAGANKS